MEKSQFLLSLGGVLVPSILVILAWIHNNTRLGRLEAGLDATNRRLDNDSASTNGKIDALSRRMDDLVRGFHTDMMGFQASILE